MGVHSNHSSTPTAFVESRIGSRTIGSRKTSGLAGPPGGSPVISMISASERRLQKCKSHDTRHKTPSERVEQESSPQRPTYRPAMAAGTFSESLNVPEKLVAGLPENDPTKLKPPGSDETFQIEPVRSPSNTRSSS